MPSATGAKVMECLRDIVRRYHSSPTMGNVIALLIIYAIVAVIGMLIYSAPMPTTILK